MMFVYKKNHQSPERTIFSTLVEGVEMESFTTDPLLDG